jgi:peptidoglycan/LPS O-acetylase OafA/YrhL
LTASSASTTPEAAGSLRRFWPFGLHEIDITSRDNNFYAVRLALAARVIFGHAFALGGVAMDHSNPTFGAIYNSLGVNGFFVVSGFLVTRSLLSSRSIADYTAARVLRITPALWAMLLITTPLVVFLGTDALARTSPDTWMSALHYLLENMSIAFVTYTIDGVFDGMANHAINGSIWSLRFEVFCYVILAVAGILGMVRKRALMLVFALALLTLFIFFGREPELSFFAKRFIRLGALFFMGSALALYPEKLRVNAWVGLLLTVAAWAVGLWANLPDLVYVAFGYFLICLAYSKAAILRTINTALELRRFGKPDLSYGIFLYSFPIQQLLYYNHVTPGPLTNILATLVLAIICAWLSSELIEKPAAKLRPHVLRLARHPA